MTKYLRINGKVILCESNIAKMNIIELLYYTRHIMAEDIINHFRKLLPDMIISFVVLLSIPISFPIMAYIRIKEAKEIVRQEREI